MIIRFIIVDPRPRKNESDVRVYQVPENSRESELLSELCEAAGLEWAIVGPPDRRRKVPKNKAT
jgi:hypothetical protein